MASIEHIALPVDSSGFTRRECPQCHANFKIRCTEEDARVLAAALSGRVAHLNVDENALPLVVRHCPYCGSTALPDAWWTEDQRRWIEEWSMALAEELRWRRLSAPLERLSDNPYPTYLPVRPDGPPELRHDPDDLMAVPVPCCGTEQKIVEGWEGAIQCHRCGASYSIAALERNIGEELNRLRDWVSDP
jgi:ribosomal protein S27AE